ncbi:MAG: protein serine/threonine phosphatase [Armatimonadetes bacterium]|nr:protein serine/threonine phosphatase [Armatimonadota bacterium]
MHLEAKAQALDEHSQTTAADRPPPRPDEPPPGEPPPAEQPVGEPPGEPAPLEMPPPGTPSEAPPPAVDPMREPTVGDPPSREPPVQAAVTDLEPITAPPAEVVASAGSYLPELTIPLEAPPAAQLLPAGTTLQAPFGAVVVSRHVKSEAGVQYYEAEWEGRPVMLLAADGPARERLVTEAGMLAGLSSPMFPRVVDRFEQDERFYLVVEISEGPTLAEALPDLPFPQVVSVLAQVTHGVKSLHEAGWAHLGLRPSGIVMGRPVQITDLSFATRLGERPAAPFYHAGYSPPELLVEQPVDARADVYSLGALLFHAVSGKPIAETGIELSTWEPPRPIAGVPQILERCLGPRETRYPSVDLLHRDLVRLARRLAPPVRYSVAAATSIGLEPTRVTNQDAFVWLTGSVASEEGLRDWAVLCVSDGMGGMAAGEVASNAAVKRLAAEAGPAMARFTAITAEEQVQVVKQWMHAANDSATDAMERLGVRGGATLVCACVVGRRLTISHVGDCRLYLLRGGEIRQLNRDHSLVMALALQGQIRVEEIRSHPDRSTITRSLGDRRPLPEAHVDTLQQVTGQPTLELQARDVLLLCSDGLWEPVVEEQMLRAVEENAPDLTAAADELVRLALEGGGPDNIAAMLFRLDQTVPEVPDAPGEEKPKC